MSKTMQEEKKSSRRTGGLYGPVLQALQEIWRKKVIRDGEQRFASFPSIHFSCINEKFLPWLWLATYFHMIYLHMDTYTGIQIYCYKFKSLVRNQQRVSWVCIYQCIFSCRFNCIFIFQVKGFIGKRAIFAVSLEMSSS